MVSVCRGLLGEEGRVSTSVDTRLNRIPLYILNCLILFGVWLRVVQYPLQGELNKEQG